MRRLLFISILAFFIFQGLAFAETTLYLTNEITPENTSNWMMKEINDNPSTDTSTYNRFTVWAVGSYFPFYPGQGLTNNNYNLPDERQIGWRTSGPLRGYVNAGNWTFNMRYYVWVKDDDEIPEPIYSTLYAILYYRISIVDSTSANGVNITPWQASPNTLLYLNVKDGDPGRYGQETFNLTMPQVNLSDQHIFVELAVQWNWGNAQNYLHIALVADELAENITLPEYTPETTPPIIGILSPQNGITYNTTSVDLNFTVDEPTSWIEYGLDGQPNITITGNTTLNDLSSGLHNIIIYATDCCGNTGYSEKVYFTVIDTIQSPNYTIFNLKTTPTSPIEYLLGNNYQFNASVLTPDFAKLELDWVEHLVPDFNYKYLNNRKMNWTNISTTCSDTDICPSIDKLNNWIENNTPAQFTSNKKNMTAEENFIYEINIFEANELNISFAIAMTQYSWERANITYSIYNYATSSYDKINTEEKSAIWNNPKQPVGWIDCLTFYQIIPINNNPNRTQNGKIRLKITLKEFDNYPDRVENKIGYDVVCNNEIYTGIAILNSLLWARVSYKDFYTIFSNLLPGVHKYKWTVYDPATPQVIYMTPIMDYNISGWSESRAYLSSPFELNDTFTHQRRPNTNNDSQNYCTDKENAYNYDGVVSTCDGGGPKEPIGGYWWNNTNEPGTGTINSVQFGVKLNSSGSRSDDNYFIEYGFANANGNCSVGVSSWIQIKNNSFPGATMTWHNVTNITAVTWTNVNNTCFRFRYEKTGKDDGFIIYPDAFHINVNYSKPQTYINVSCLVRNTNNTALTLPDYYTEIYLPNGTIVSNNTGSSGFFNITIPLQSGLYKCAIYNNESRLYNASYNDTARYPNIIVISPQNNTVYGKISVPLTFSIYDQSTPWVNYSLDNQSHITITGNTTLSVLLDGSRNIILYVNDSGRIDSSDKVYFYYCLGDITNDGNVTIADLSLLGQKYGTRNSDADINGNGVVDVFDLFILGKNYGKTCNVGAKSEVPSVTTFYIEPENISNSDLIPNTTFDVNVSVDQVENLYAFEFKLKYDPNILTATKVVDSFLNKPTWIGTKKIDNSKGEIQLGITSWTGAKSKTGKGIIATITFQVKDFGKSNLDIYYSELVNFDIKPIGHDVKDGHFNNFVQANIDIDPNVLNLRDKGKWITSYISLPSNYNVSDINISTVKLWYENNSTPAELGEIKNDTLIVKFDKFTLQSLLAPKKVELTVTGKVLYNNMYIGFEGKDTIEVI